MLLSYLSLAWPLTTASAVRPRCWQVSSFSLRIRWDWPSVHGVTVLRVDGVRTVYCVLWSVMQARPHTSHPLSHMGMARDNPENWGCMMFLFEQTHRDFTRWFSDRSLSEALGRVPSCPAAPDSPEGSVASWTWTRQHVRHCAPLSDQNTEPDHNSSWHQWMANYAVMLTTDTWRAGSVMNGFNMPLNNCKQKTMEYLISRGWMHVLYTFW